MAYPIMYNKLDFYNVSNKSNSFKLPVLLCIQDFVPVITNQEVLALFLVQDNRNDKRSESSTGDKRNHLEAINDVMMPTRPIHHVMVSNLI